MLQVFYLNVVKVDRVLHMLQRDPPATTAGEPPWVTVRAPKAGRHIHDTTGLLEFAECPKHSAKDRKHSANGSPSVTLGE